MGVNGGGAGVGEFFTINPNLKIKNKNKNNYWRDGGGGGGWVGGGGMGGRKDGWTDEQAQPNLPLQLLQSINVQVMQVMSLTSSIYDHFIF